jgi:hypothetical protein
MKFLAMPPTRHVLSRVSNMLFSFGLSLPVGDVSSDISWKVSATSCGEN